MLRSQTDHSARLDNIPVINDAPAWTAVRKAKNWQDNGFVSDVTSNDIRCNQLNPGNDTVSVAAGDKVSVTFNNDLYHPGPFRKHYLIGNTDIVHKP